MAEAAELGDRLTMETKGGKHDLSDREVAVPLMEKKDTPNKEPIGRGVGEEMAACCILGM